MNRKVIAVVNDIFFASKIRASAAASGVLVQFVRSTDQLVQTGESSPPDLIIVDLHNQSPEPIGLARALKANESFSTVQLVGFFSHVDTELQRVALEAGFDKVIPRSVFARDLPAILSGG